MVSCFRATVKQKQPTTRNQKNKGRRRQGKQRTNQVESFDTSTIYHLSIDHLPTLLVMVQFYQLVY